MYVLNRRAVVSLDYHLANDVARIATTGSHAIPVDFFDTQAQVRTYGPAETQKFCNALERNYDHELTHACRQASWLVIVVFDDRVLVYNELDEADVQKLMEELTAARKHLFQVYLAVNNLVRAT